MVETITSPTTEVCPQCGSELAVGILEAYAAQEHPAGTTCPECPRNGARKSGNAPSKPPTAARDAAKDKSARPSRTLARAASVKGARHTQRDEAPKSADRKKKSAASQAAPAPKSQNLRPGELERLVLDYVSRQPGPFSPTQLAKALNRSSGAVANALDKHAKVGTQVRETSHKPKRYAAVAAAETAVQS